MKISENDRSILRRLAEKQREIADLPVHEKTKGLWTRLNDLKKSRPLVWINEIPWHEMNVDDELTLLCENEFCRSVENEFRRLIYQWTHMPCDMLVEPLYRMCAVIKDSGFGIAENSDIIQGGVNSRHFHPQITCEADIEKIKIPEISFDKAMTEERKEFLENVFGDILRVEIYGIGMQWFAPWDILITWYGVEEAMIDMALRPELVHASMEKLVDSYIARMEQYEKLNLLSLNNGNFRIGSGGLGYTDELPQDDVSPSRIRCADQWGCAAAQIFSEVSPQMHEEFALKYERRWLERFGLTYYGCCEQLHNKLPILRTIRNLRKISVSPWANLDKMVEDIQKDYVLSVKPNPAVFAGDDWTSVAIEHEFSEILQKTRGAHLEIILKDISTVRNQPLRLWEWAKLAMLAVEQCS